MITTVGAHQCHALTLVGRDPTRAGVDVVAAIAESGRRQIRKELDLMVTVLDAAKNRASTP